MLNRTLIRVVLAKRRQTLKSVAEQSGLDLLRTYRIVNTSVRAKPEELEALAGALGVSPDELRLPDAPMPATMK